MTVMTRFITYVRQLFVSPRRKHASEATDLELTDRKESTGSEGIPLRAMHRLAEKTRDFVGFTAEDVCADLRIRPGCVSSFSLAA